MIFQKGINWSEYDPQLKNGRIIVKEVDVVYPPVSGTETEPGHCQPQSIRSKWTVKPAWVFTQDPQKLQNLIPKYG